MAIVTINATPNFQCTQQGGGILAGVSVSKTETLRSIFYTAGVQADQLDTLHMKTYTFVATTPQTLDLTALTDIFGNAISFARVKVIALKLLSATDGQAIVLGNAVTNEWSGAAAMLSAAGTIRVLAGTANNDGYVIVGAPNTTGYVVDPTHKALKLDPGAGAFTAEVIIAGCSA